MKLFIAALAALTLVACDQTPLSGGSSRSGTVALGSTQDLPDWLLVARQRDCQMRACIGQVFFNQRTITRNGDGTADIWTKTEHGVSQAYIVQSGRTTTTVHFQQEREHYRFKCDAQQFTIVERQIMGAGETVVAHDNPIQIYRNPAPGSLVPIILPIACNGS